jgi:EAL domain-containing protein (putative c-di-GMP-specific phosphodiesterase class I)
MYQVKNDGKNNYCFYSSDLSTSAFENLTLDTLLHRALERNQLEVYYQPQISLSNGRIVGAEALLRWHHPELGIISPAKFIPLAEETGLIIQIGEWVLREAAKHAVLFVEMGLPLQWIAVNVSSTQIHRGNFADTVYSILVETGCDPNLLELEITESAIMNNAEFVIEVFRRIKDMGVNLALDDFGTGYSSLSYLKRFPLDKLKIDQSFVRGLPHDQEDAAIAGAIIALGQSLGFSVIAEGVETLEQEAFVRSKGCQEAQGYLYSHPVALPRLIELLRAQDLQQDS